MNEQSDGWQVAEAFFQDFLLRTRGSSKLIAHSTPFEPPRWVKYNNGGAMDTYCNGREYNPFPPEVKVEQIEDLVVLVDGKPTAMPGPTPWGNKSQGTAFHQGNYIWVSPHDGKHPSETKMELRYAIREKVDGGKPAVTLEATDSVWYYGGSYFKSDYLYNRRATWKGVHYGLAGRGHFACYGWKPAYRLWWYDKGKPIIFSPAYEGLRDSAEDSAYYRRLQSLGATDEVLQMIVGTDESAALRLVEERSKTIFVNDDIGPKTTFADYNLAKKRMLKALADYE
jgi:hypothetical protein